ncbi:hypothetical protein HPP92_028575 [Vanilla planifolia]|uniref:Uncharacterized protein n=1 Tax=Vanilla planifolia TaxID=51239 RepID=A0A835P861_VANPL|nr:hypothetical protein HPP92_028575 [Vanilla planifolia]
MVTAANGSKDESARDKEASVVEHLLEAESEIKTLRKVAQKMILNQEEMEEVILKRCWLARYWKLCVPHGNVVGNASPGVI